MTSMRHLDLKDLIHRLSVVPFSGQLVLPYIVNFEQQGLSSDLVYYSKGISSSQRFVVIYMHQ
jgi:hypothetical protein